MKKIKSLLSATIFTLLFSTISNTVQAQNAFGGGITLNSYGDGNIIGLNPRARIGLGDKLALGADINYIADDGYAFIGLNGNIQYLLGDPDALSFYPMGGLHLLTFSSYKAIGINLGFGGNYALNDKLAFFVDFKLKMMLEDGFGVPTTLGFGVMFSP